MSDNITDFAILSKEERYKKLRDGYMKKVSTSDILKELKKRYRKEPAILDYIEMIECEL